jgi:hypothetical protein
MILGLGRRHAVRKDHFVAPARSAVGRGAAVDGAVVGGFL